MSQPRFFAGTAVSGRLAGPLFVMVTAMYSVNDRRNDLDHSAQMRRLVGQIRADLPRRLPRRWATDDRFAGYASLDSLVAEIASMSPESDHLVRMLMAPAARHLPYRCEVLLCGLAPIAIDKTADRARTGHLLTELTIITSTTEDLSMSMHAAHGLVSRAMDRGRTERRRLHNPAETLADDVSRYTTGTTGSPEDEVLACLGADEFRAATADLNFSIDADDLLAAYASGTPTGELGYERVYRFRARTRPMFDQLIAA